MTIRRNGATMRSTRALVAIAVATPPVLGALFVPLFRWVQARGLPPGSLQGLDLTAFAQRDELMMRSFGWALVVFVMTLGLLATSWRSRLVVVVVGGVAAAVSYVAVFGSLLAG